MLATRQSNDEAIREYSANKYSPNQSTAPAADLTTPNSVSDIDKPPQVDVWRHSMDKEFGGLFQPDTFTPAPAKQSVANVIDTKWVLRGKLMSMGV